MSLEYPQIETVFERDAGFRVGDRLRLPEFGLVRQWLVTEKIDGMNVRVEWSLGDDGYADVAFKGRTDNAQMPTFLYEYLREVFKPPVFGECFDRPSSGTLYGEGYGAKIQKGGIYRPSPGFRLFDVRVGEWWLNWDNVEEVAFKLGLATVPVLGLTTISDAAAWVQSDAVSPVAVEDSDQTSKAEGVVARTDPLLFTRKGDRLMWKLKGKDFSGKSRRQGDSK